MEVLLVGLAGVAAAGSTGLLLVVRAVLRRNRVSPRERTRAPISWLWSLRQAPRLHRSLRKSAASARLALVAHGRSTASFPALVELGEELGRRACEIDDQLVVAHRAPAAARRRMLETLARETFETEHLTERLACAARAWAQQGRAAPTVVELHHRLDALEQAMSEIRTLEGIPQQPVWGPAS